MAYYLIEDFRSGLDVRRSPWSSPAGTLQVLNDGHITRGGEIEKRKAFVEIGTFPEGTFGLAADKNGPVTFGSNPQPAGLPPGVNYHRMLPSGGQIMVGIDAVTLFAGNIYAVGRYIDGQQRHFYNGTQVTTWTYGEVRTVFTFKNKVYATSDTLLAFSGVGTPANWTTGSGGAVGAGFINMSNEFYGAEPLEAISSYGQYLAIAARQTSQIWYVDPDPTGNRQQQVLANVGCVAPRSMVGIGDIDVFFLSDTGVRSLRARDSSNSAFASDIGTPIDPLVIATLRGLSAADKRKAVAAIEPEDGRYTLSLGDRLYVFSYFAGAKISAWSNYLPPSPVTDIAIFQGRMYVRCANNKLYLYGGADNNTYDATQVKIELPFFDARSPATGKQFTAIDLGIEGEWIVDACFDPANPDFYERICQVDQPTFAMARIPMTAHSTHFKLRLRSVGTGYARLSNIAVHYDGTDSDKPT